MGDEFLLTEARSSIVEVIAFLYFTSFEDQLVNIFTHQVQIKYIKVTIFHTSITSAKLGQ